MFATAAPASPSSSSSSSSEAVQDGEYERLMAGDAFAELVQMAAAADPSLADRAAASAAGPSPAAAVLPLSNKPYWLRQRAAQGERYDYLKAQLGGLKLATVCEEAQCPNIGECWNGGAAGIGTATIMLLGDTCTRGCRFCAVNTSQAPPPPDPLEPEHTAQVGGWVGGWAWWLCSLWFSLVEVDRGCLRLRGCTVQVAQGAPCWPCPRRRAAPAPTSPRLSRASPRRRRWPTGVWGMWC